MTQVAVVGVVGLGVMGLGIAQVFAAAGFRVLATDAVPEARAAACERMAQGLAARVAAGKLAAHARDATLAHFEVVEGVAALGPCDLVIEAIVEKLGPKRALLAALEAVVRGDAVLATNTSSIRVAEIAEGLQHPERVLALHFFNPAVAMKLVELAGHKGTAPVAAAVARAAVEATGKVVVACADRPGFIVNRCARPYYGEALALLEEGRRADEIDAAMVAAGYPLGPFALIDLIGADTHLAATQGMLDAMGGHPRYWVFGALRAAVSNGDLGRKSGRGFVVPGAAEVAPPDAGGAAVAH